MQKKKCQLFSSSCTFFGARQQLKRDGAGSGRGGQREAVARTSRKCSSHAEHVSAPVSVFQAHNLTFALQKTEWTHTLLWQGPETELAKGLRQRRDLASYVLSKERSAFKRNLGYSVDLFPSTASA